MSRKLTQEDVINRFKEVHGDTYDYSGVIYTKTTAKVVIKCGIHGAFLIATESHEKGVGCPSCRAISNRKTNKQFIEDASKTHNNFYDYSETVYNGARNKVKIICPIHGEFTQAASAHSHGKGCPKCSYEATGTRCRNSLENFITKARKSHGDTYDYSKVEYLNGHAKVLITCKTHGDFLQKPNHHCDGVGCPSCGKETTSHKLMMGKEDFIDRAVKVHGNLYSYSKVKYKNSATKLIVTCKIHGDWSTTPANHLIGSGCPACGMKQTGFDDNKISNLYILTADDRTKVGITNRSVDKRLREIKSDSQIGFEILKVYPKLEGGLCRSIENKILKLLSSQYPSITGIFTGSTECFIGVNNAWLLNTIEEIIKEYNIETN